MCENNQLTINYNKFDWFIRKEKMHEEQKENNKEKDKEKDKNQNINSFLVDFIKNNDIEKKRGNSMMSLRHSKTLASLSTCDDSVCFEEKIENKSKKKSNMLIIDNSEIHRQKTKDMIQKMLQAPLAYS